MEKIKEKNKCISIMVILREGQLDQITNSLKKV
jgi:hypothetical protein